MPTELTQSSTFAQCFGLQKRNARNEKNGSSNSKFTMNKYTVLSLVQHRLVLKFGDLIKTKAGNLCKYNK